MIPSATSTLGATSEVGTLRTVLLHRPGPELRRLTPRNNDQLLFDGVPWVPRAQEEHDAFAAELTARGVEFTGPVEDHGYGLVTHFRVPGGFAVQLYQPRYTKRASDAAR